MDEFFGRPDAADSRVWMSWAPFYWQPGRRSTGNLGAVLLATWARFYWQPGRSSGRGSTGNLDAVLLATWTLFSGPALVATLVVRSGLGQLGSLEHAFGGMLIT